MGGHNRAINAPYNIRLIIIKTNDFEFKNKNIDIAMPSKDMKIRCLGLKLLLGFSNNKQKTTYEIEKVETEIAIKEGENLKTSLK
jgi:hypothetical protein